MAVGVRRRLKLVGVFVLGQFATNEFCKGEGRPFLSTSGGDGGGAASSSGRLELD